MTALDDAINRGEQQRQARIAAAKAARDAEHQKDVERCITEINTTSHLYDRIERAVSAGETYVYLTRIDASAYVDAVNSIPGLEATFHSNYDEEWKELTALCPSLTVTWKTKKP